MWILVNCFLLMLSALLMALGITFWLRNREAPWRNNYYIMAYCITSSVWCFAYGLMGITDDFAFADILRKVGVSAIEAFLVNEVFFITGMFKQKTKAILIPRIVMIILAAIDFVVFSQTGVNQFVRIGNWTTWTVNPAFNYARVIHSHFVVIAFFMTLITGIIWAKTNELKRNKIFIQLMFLANFILIFFTAPDTLLPILRLYAVPTSGIGAAGCAMVMWFAATRLNSFDIRMGNIIDEMYDFINAGVLVFDTDEGITMANPFARSLTDKYITGGNISELFDMDDKTGEELFARSLEDTYSVNLRGKDGNTYSLQINAVLDDYNEPYCFMCIFMDITKEVDLISELEVANNAKTSFLTSMSHEIRTPINAIIGFNEMIGRESEDQDIREYSGHIDRAAHHLLSIINNLLDMERVTTGKLPVNPEEYDLSNVIRDAYSLNVLKAAGKDLDLLVEGPPDIPRYLYGDSVRVQQIIVNLISNAVKYTRTGSVTLELDYRKRDEDDIDLIIRVRDTGIGIRKEDMPRLFSLFERFDRDNNKHIEGTGLGLALTKKIAEIMGGSIEVESEYGKGSCFTVTIPQKVTSFENPGLDMSVAASGGRGYSASFTAPNAHVLVVDDNELNLKVASGLMKPLKIQVDCVESGEEMLELVKTKKYDIIFLDHLMPGMDGITAFKKLREDRTVSRDIPVIAMTANAIRGMKEKFLEEGFTDFIPKPVEPRELEEMLHRHLRAELIEAADVYAAKEPPDAPANSIPPAFFGVEGIDIKMVLSGSTDLAMAEELMETFCNSAPKELSQLKEFYEKGVRIEDADGISGYRIKVHSMKNSAATVGAAALSERAKALEMAAKDEDREYIIANHENFAAEYEDLAARLSKAISKGENADKESLPEMLSKAVTAMENSDTMLLGEIAYKLENEQYDSEDVKTSVRRLLDAIRDFDEDAFYKAADEIRKLLA